MIVGDVISGNMLDVAFVGTGADPESPDQDGFAMAYRHSTGYQRLDNCRIAACADIVPENAHEFADHHGIPDDRVFKDYEMMLHEADPDVVSVCVPPDVHADVVVGCAESGIPAAIHCEKPIATTWADCRQMTEVCDKAGVQLTINHQRRTGPIFRKAKELLDDGRIGDLRRIEWGAPNLFDTGTHLFDLSNFYADDQPVEWVLCGLDYREENKWFGAHNENQAVAQWRYEDGTWATASTGVAEDAVGCYVRLEGTSGTIELGADDGAPLRYRNSHTFGWTAVEVGENIWGEANYPTWRAALALAIRHVPVGPDDPFQPPGHIATAIAEVVDALNSDREPAISARRALNSTELIFAAWESVRSRERIDLPLEIDDNPLEAMVESGMLAFDGDGDDSQTEPVGHGPDSETETPSESSAD